MWRIAAPLLILLVAVGGEAQAADEWKDARKAFKTAQKSTDWRTRMDSYTELAYFDTEKCAKEMLGALAKEKNPAVVLGGIRTLSGLKSKEAKAYLAGRLAKTKGMQKLHVLMVLEKQKGPEADKLLLGVLRGKDRMAAAQAALALGKKKVVEAIPDLREMMIAKEWQIRAAAARALMDLRAMKAIPDLAEGLSVSKGSERGPIIRALTELTGEKFGANAASWKKLAKGLDAEEIPHKDVKTPHVFGIPIYGKRVVVVLTNSQRNEDSHRFGTAKRLEELCLVPGGRPIRHSRLVTVGTFIRAHVKRLFRDLPSGTKAELISFNTAVKKHFGKLTPLNTSLVDELHETIDALIPGAGMNHYDSLNLALDMGGPRDKDAWTKGPDEIVFTVCNAPNQGEIKEAAVVAAAIAFKARMRMVPIHAIGVESHDYEMLKTIAGETGATYLNLYE